MIGLFWALSSGAEASCLERYDLAITRRSRALTVDSGAVLSTTLGAVAAPAVVSTTANPGMEAVAYGTLALWFFSGGGLAGAGILDGVFTTRYTAMNRVYPLLVEAEMGGGPALDAYSADLAEALDQPVSAAQLAAVLHDLDQRELLCTPRPLGFREVDALLRQAIREDPVDTAPHFIGR